MSNSPTHKPLHRPPVPPSHPRQNPTCTSNSTSRPDPAWGGYSNVFDYPAALQDAGLRFAQIVVWVKGHPVMTRKDFMGNHESAFYGWKPGAAHWFNPEIHNATDVWEVKKVTPQEMIHLTEKPVELATLAMKYSSRTGENVLDFFDGSGSTLIGAEMTGRRAFLLEIDPLYCDVIRRRWAEFVKGEGCDWEALTALMA